MSSKEDLAVAPAPASTDPIATSDPVVTDPAPTVAETKLDDQVPAQPQPQESAIDSPAPEASPYIKRTSTSNLSKAGSHKSKASVKLAKSYSQKSKLSSKAPPENAAPVAESNSTPDAVSAPSIKGVATPKAHSIKSNIDKEAKEKESKEKEEKEKIARKEKSRKERERKEQEERLKAIKEKEDREKAAKEKQIQKDKEAKAKAAAKKSPPVVIPADVSKIDPLQNVEAPSTIPTPNNETTEPIIDKEVVLATLPPIVKPKDPFAYRHFTSLHPCANRLLAMQWDRDDRKKHLKKLAAVKPKVDNCAPKLYRHLQTKPKKHQMDQERQAEIHRNNRILLERMSNIMYMEAHDPEIHATRRFQVLTNAGPRARAREQMKIALENKKLFERLQGKQPDYNRHKLLDQHFKHLLHLQNISSFPQKYIAERRECQVTMKRLKSGKHAMTADGRQRTTKTSHTLPQIPRPKTSGDMIGAL